MEYINNIIKLFKENKWSSIFIIFGIMVAYSIGKQYAQNQKQEDFMDDLDAYKDKKPILKELPKKPKKKKIIASASCPEMPDLNKYILKTELPNLNDYVHKSLVPDLQNYLSKPYVRQNFISKTKLDEEYILKTECEQNNKEQELVEEVIIVDEKICDKKISNASNPNEIKNSINLQKKFDDNKQKLIDNYSYIEDVFTNCNMRTCPINQKQTGLFSK